MEKRGISHIEVILAFLLFISGVTTAVYIFDPVSDSKLSLNMNKYTSSALEEELSTNIDIYGILVDKNKDSFKVNLNRDLSGMNLIVKDSSGTIIPSKITNPTNGEITFGKGESNSNGNNEIVYAYIGKDIPVSSSEISGDPQSAEVISFRFLKIMSKKKADSFKQRYDDSAEYSKIKKELSLPENLNFDFNIIFNDNKNNIEANKDPGRTNVFIDKRRIEILINNNIEYANFEVKTW